MIWLIAAVSTYFIGCAVVLVIAMITQAWERHSKIFIAPIGRDETPLVVVFWPLALALAATIRAGDMLDEGVRRAVLAVEGETTDVLPDDHTRQAPHQPHRPELRGLTDLWEGEATDHGGDEAPDDSPRTHRAPEHPDLRDL